MKFSRNPESGILECYTDDGVYIGDVYTSEPVNELTKNEADVEKSDMSGGE